MSRLIPIYVRKMGPEFTQKHTAPGKVPEKVDNVSIGKSFHSTRSLEALRLPLGIREGNGNVRGKQSIPEQQRFPLCPDDELPATSAAR